MKRRLLISSLFLAISITGCDMLQSEIDSSESQMRSFSYESEPKPPVVTSYVVTSIENNSDQGVIGNVAPPNQIDVSFGVSGQIAQIHVKKGDRVGAGQLLASLNTTAWQQDISVAKSRLDQASAEREKGQLGANQHDVREQELRIEGAKQKLSTAVAEREKGEKLFESGVITRNELDKLKQEESNATLGLREAENGFKKINQGLDPAQRISLDAGIKQAQAGVIKAEQDLKDSKVVAPVSGVIADINQRVSERSGPGQTLLTITEEGDWEVHLQVSQSQLGQWKQGMKSMVVAGSNKALPGTVQYVSSTPDEKSNMYQVEISMQEAPKDWYAGMEVTVRLANKSGSSVYVPVSAVGIEDEGPYIFSIVDGRIFKARVKLGTVQGNLYEVVEGLEEGEAIVKSSISHLSDEQIVQVKQHEQ
ncbi:efflux RND transporter periplasmic adaptor subunit [Brevibacillus daliensis]|uniref:efflux RND transporter periplasmic adaptor subunit n=1 Tax=Brevibacillus daliensis TaxID=2892995 RepID=UPI001E3914C8|nr:efflux RND transporter periplasmic adaptor subunit [Brevibacillus daliensis]